MKHEGKMDDQEENRRMADSLRDWWIDTADAEVTAIAPKAVEYGSGDLESMGRALAEIVGVEMDREEATEFGIYFYALGKMARWTAALKAGRRVSDDTLLDLGVYIKMAQRVREVGSWPNAQTSEG